VAAVFAIPVIVRRGETNPFQILRDSAATLRRTWGESVTGFVGIQIAGAVAVAVVAGLAIAVMIGGVALKSALVFFSAIVACGLGLIAVGVAFSLATHIFRCALYIYASEGVVPQPFTPELMDAAWKVKTRK
jgi:hypothetical protein